MKQKLKNMEILYLLIKISGGIFIAIASLSIYFFFVNGYFQYKDWITLVISFAGTLLGGIITMSGVVLSLNRTIDNEEKQVNEKIKKLKIILGFEIENFISSFEKEILRYIEKQRLIVNENLDKLNTKPEFNLWQERINYKNIYKVDSNCKEYIYELILLDNKANTNELIEFYKLYSILEEKLPTINSNIKDIEESISKFLSKNYKDIMAYIHYWGFGHEENMVIGLNFIQGNRKEINSDINNLSKELKNGVIHKSELICRVLNYLKSK